VRTSKSPKRVLETAFEIGRRSLPEYAHKYSPRKFTQPQLFACLVLKEFLRLDYRKLQAFLVDAPTIGEAVGLSTIPHFTTFQKAAVRLLKSRRAQRLLDVSVEHARKQHRIKWRVRLAAVDGTGFETRHISAYFVKRRQKGQKHEFQTTTYTRYPYAAIACDCASHIILAIVPGRGPGPDDPYFQQALNQMGRRVRVDTLLADAGFDSEGAHVFAREEHGMRTIIPPTRGRPTTKLPTGRWRRVMATRFNKNKYGQRWQVETVNSMIKRLIDSALRARQYWSQWREITLRALTHNIMILWIRFSTEQAYPHLLLRPTFETVG
jgi:hypothetical protein